MLLLDNNYKYIYNIDNIIDTLFMKLFKNYNEKKSFKWSLTFTVPKYNVLVITL